jgi:hypothetical protein
MPMVQQARQHNPQLRTFALKLFSLPAGLDPRLRINGLTEELEDAEFLRSMRRSSGAPQPGQSDRTPGGLAAYLKALPPWRLGASPSSPAFI